MLRSIGWQELLFVVVIAFLLFGSGKKLGDMGKGLGDAIKNFKTAMKGDEKPEDKKAEEKKSA
jgi:sec-independent protein translocase protein TatA